MKPVLVLLIVICSFRCYSQDFIITNNHDTLSGKIKRITEDTVFFDVRFKKSIISSFISMDKIKSYEFGIIKKLKQENDTTSLYTLTMKNKMVLYGTVKSITRDAIDFKTDMIGVMHVEAINIKNIERSVGEIDDEGEYWFPNPNDTRYFFAPSAYNLKKGEGYYQNAYVVLNSVNIGVTDYFSIGGGLEFISTFSGYLTAFITPKVGFKVSEKIGVGSGLILGIVGSEATAGILYGICTYGSHDHNITGGLGWGFIDNNFNNNPIINLNGMTRVGRRFALVTENWIVPMDGEYYEILSYGFRFFSEKMSVDVAFINNRDISKELFIGMPYADFVLKF